MVRVGEERAAAHRAAPPCVFPIDRRGKGVDGKSLGTCIAIAKQQEAVAGFANDFRMPRDMIANLTHGEFFFVGHGANDVSCRLEDKAKKVIPIEFHRVLLFAIVQYVYRHYVN